jgi:peptidoglycan/xylan/chitin deacetylase (PgdA/CDA1 family)
MMLTAASKRWIKRAILGSRGLQLATRARPGVAVLIYHSVLDRPTEQADTIGAGIIHSSAVFAEQMEVVARHYTPVTVEDIRLFLAGAGRMPRKAVAVTFDDGFADNFAVAAPILDRFGIRASFYVTVDAVDRGQPPWFCRLRHAFARTAQATWRAPYADGTQPLLTPLDHEEAFLSACRHCARLAGPAQEEAVAAVESCLQVEPLVASPRLMMTWDEVRALRQAGHIVGSHTLSHPNVAHVSDAELQREVKESGRRLEQRLGAPVTHFSYPWPTLQPHWTARTTTVAREAGYRTAVTCTPGAVRRRHDPLSLRRVAAPQEAGEFHWRLEWAFLGRRR